MLAVGLIKSVVKCLVWTQLIAIDFFYYKILFFTNNRPPPFFFPTKWETWDWMVGFC